MNNYRYEPVLMHHGIKGMRWGVRRSRNEGASGNSSKSSTKNNSDGKGKAKRYIIAGAAATATALAIYGGYKLNKVKKERALLELRQQAEIAANNHRILAAHLSTLQEKAGLKSAMKRNSEARKERSAEARKELSDLIKKLDTYKEKRSTPVKSFEELFGDVSNKK